MTPYWTSEKEGLATLYHGDNGDVLPTIPDESIDALFCDPPGGIAFRQATWDKPGVLGVSGGRAMPATTASRNPSCRKCHQRKRGKTKRCTCEEPEFDETDKRLQDRELFVAWLTDVMAECIRVLKPGAHALVWTLPRTSGWTHRAIEDAGFEIRDCIEHLFSQGYKKGTDIAKAIDQAAGFAIPDEDEYEPRTDDAKRWYGFHTGLKPAHEGWILARKPIATSTVVENVLKHGTGALHTDACRVYTDWSERSEAWKRSGHSAQPDADKIAAPPGNGITCHPDGRWAPNLLLSHAPCCRPFADTTWWECLAACECGLTRRAVTDAPPPPCECGAPMHWACPVAELDRQSGPDCGADGRKPGLPQTISYAGGRGGAPAPALKRSKGGASMFFPVFGYFKKASAADRNDGITEGENTHPTVKGKELCLAWLARLEVPSGGTVLDPFMGSGSIGVAVVRQGMRFIGIEREAVHVEEARQRIAQAERDLTQERTGQGLLFERTML